MGIERWYIAVVDGGPLLERALVDPDFGINIQCPSYFRPQRDRERREGVFAEFMAEVDAMNVVRPGIEARVVTLDRWFDMLHYLLSQTRRRGEPHDFDDPGTQAILGAKPLPNFLRGGQGHPIRYSPPAEVAVIAAWMESQSTDDLRAAYHPDAMEQSVYKFSQSRDSEETLDRILAYFEGLRAFYHDAAAHGEGVLAVVT